MQLEPYIKEIANEKHEEKWVGIVDPRKIKLGSRKYYRYMGSLTISPCTEGVVWTIVKKVGIRKFYKLAFSFFCYLCFDCALVWLF